MAAISRGRGSHISILRESSELLAKCALTSDLLQVGASLMVVQNLAEFRIISLQCRDTDASRLFR